MHLAYIYSRYIKYSMNLKKQKLFINVVEGVLVYVVTHLFFILINSMRFNRWSIGYYYDDATFCLSVFLLSRNRIMKMIERYYESLNKMKGGIKIK